MTTEEENYRDVQNTKISESYKGILRITNVSDVDPSEDTYDNVNLYSLDEVDNTPYLIDGFTYSTPVLNGKSIRYSSIDSLKNNRIPVTDSYGNYLNWNISKTGLTIGSDIFNSNSSLVFETKTITTQNASLSDILIDKNSYKLSFEPHEKLENGSVLMVTSKENDTYKITTYNLNKFITDKLKEFDDSKEIAQIPTGTVIQYYSDGLGDLENDYLVCDGSICSVGFNNKKYFDLFFMIGYTYTDTKENKDKDFQNDILELLAFDVIYDCFQNYKGETPITVDYVNNTLRNSKIPESYIFNLLYFDETDENEYFMYNGEKMGKEVNTLESIVESEKVQKFISMMMNGEEVNNNVEFSYSFQVPQMNYTTTTYIGSKNGDEVFSEWRIDDNDFIIPHRHFIAVSQGNAHRVNDDTYTILFKQYNINFTDKITGEKESYNVDTEEYNFRPLSSDRILVGEHCDFDIDTPSSFDIYNDSYILRDIPMQLTTTYKINSNSLFTRGINKTIPSKTLYGGFNTLTLEDNEPNRGLSGDAIFDGNLKEDIKAELNKECFNGNIFFTMENIASLPLIKI